MTLDGRVDREVFIEEWAQSDNRNAMFLLSGEEVYLMPYGHFDFTKHVDPEQRFSGPYRMHQFVKRDFEIATEINGGGCLKLTEDKSECSYDRKSREFGPVAHPQDVVDLINREILKKS